MPARKYPQEYATVGPKDFWHSYSLQGLPAGRFAQVVQEIIAGRNNLISTRAETSDEMPETARAINPADKS